MKYRYERIISGMICFISIDWNGSVTITDSTFPHLIALVYPNLETFEKQYPDYKFMGNTKPIPVNPGGLLYSWLKDMSEFDKLAPERINVMPVGCSHTFVSYTGIVETFEYCTKCDAKKGR